MQKIIGQGVVIIVVFAALFFGFQQIDWMTLFKVEEVTAKTEEKIGDMLWDFYKNNGEESTDDFMNSSVDSVVTKLCKANGFDRDNIKLHVVHKDEVNAFVIPGNHMIVYTGLIKDCDNQEQLIGVIGHELAHLKLNHVMHKLVKEIGLSTLIAMTTGNSPEVIVEAARLISSTAFDRGYEKEADLKAVDYMVKADVNPEPFADFLYRMSDKEVEGSEYFTWISTHPASKERSKYVLDYCKLKSSYEKKQFLTNETWEKLKEKASTEE